MKGLLGLVTAATILWIFWMSFEWLRNRNKFNQNKNQKNEKVN